LFRQSSRPNCHQKAKLTGTVFGRWRDRSSESGLLCTKYVSPDDAAVERYWQIRPRAVLAWQQRVYQGAKTLRPARPPENATSANGDSSRRSPRQRRSPIRRSMHVSRSCPRRALTRCLGRAGSAASSRPSRWTNRTGKLAETSGGDSRTRTACPGASQGPGIPDRRRNRRRPRELHNAHRQRGRATVDAAGAQAGSQV
jgi:hypothetical protein